MHIETGGPSRRLKQHQKVRSPIWGGKDRTCALFSARDGTNVSDPPKQKMVGTVIPSDCFTAIGESEVLIAITTGYD